MGGDGVDRETTAGDTNGGEPNALERVVDWMVDNALPSIEPYVSMLRDQNPGLSDRALADKIVRRKSLKNGLVGAATGVGGLLTLPVAVPADVVASWRIQISMVLAVAAAFRRQGEASDLKTDIFLVLAGDSAKEALKRLGIEASKAVTKKAVDKYITREIMQQIWKVLGRKIITKAGEKSLTSFTKMVPLVGAPVGFAFDWTLTRRIGRTAIKYYGGGG